MTTDEMLEYYERVSNDHDIFEFELVEPKLSNRRDLHAMILLDRLIPGMGHMVSASEHDEFWLDPDVDELAKVITNEQIIELVRCGVMFSEDGLSMFS